MLTITKDMGEFAAAHTLVNHDGGCANLHGHNYRVEVTLIGDFQQVRTGNTESGMIIDFTALKEVYKKHVHEVVDHAMIIGDNAPSWYQEFRMAVDCVNDQSPNYSGGFNSREYIDSLLGKVAHLPIEETTAEYFSKWILETIQAELPAYLEKSERYRSHEVMVYSVSVWETSSSKATYTNPELSPGLTARFSNESA
jgi:queuosine biosynthesis protein QueD